MPRPRHPIREHFNEIPGPERRNGSVACKYCGREQAAGNPKRCQRHLDECPQYSQVLQAIESGQQPNIPFHSPYDSANMSLHGQDGVPQYGAVTASPGYPDTPTPVHAGPVQTPLSVPETLDEEEVMRILGIDKDLYIAVECELDAQMMGLNISGAGLHTQGGRNLLKQAFYQINQKWPMQMNAISERNKTSGMITMAYIANRKRRNGQPPSTATPKTNNYPPHQAPRTKKHTTPTSNPNLESSTPVTQLPPAPFGLTTIIAERVDAGGAFVICRPGDLIDEQKDPEDISVNDLKFMPFIDLLQHDDDVMFNGNDDRIVHTFIGGRQKTVSNEVVWRVALEDMHRNGANPFVFKIYKRPARDGM